MYAKTVSTKIINKNPYWRGGGEWNFYTSLHSFKLLEKNKTKRIKKSEKKQKSKESTIKHKKAKNEKSQKGEKRNKR